MIIRIMATNIQPCQIYTGAKVIIMRRYSLFIVISFDTNILYIPIRTFPMIERSKKSSFLMFFTSEVSRIMARSKQMVIIASEPNPCTHSGLNVEYSSPRPVELRALNSLTVKPCLTIVLSIWLSDLPEKIYP